MVCDVSFKLGTGDLLATDEGGFHSHIPTLIRLERLRREVVLTGSRRVDTGDIVDDGVEASGHSCNRRACILLVMRLACPIEIVSSATGMTSSGSALAASTQSWLSNTYDSNSDLL